jgi:cell division protein FtsW
MRSKKYDKFFLVIVATLAITGFLIYISASMGLLARKGTDYSWITLKQLAAGAGVGLVALFLTFKIPYRFWKKAAIIFFLLSVALTAVVLVPGLGVSVNGAKRWLPLGPLTFQPAELLKFGFVLYCAAWLSSSKSKVKSFKFGILPFIAVLGVVAAILLKQPDTGTLIIFVITGVVMLVLSGSKWRHIVSIVLLMCVCLVGVAYARPYVMKRITTFLDPSLDALGASYQMRQAILAIGSGQIFGKGFGQSVQKFNFLPEPTSDSIFAVAAEEFGFIGSTVIVLLFLAFALRGLRIAARAPDAFGRLLAAGFVMLIVSQSFVNIAAMLGLIPLTGLPLLFISQGGTAFVITMAEVGIILNISRYASKRA